MPEAVVDGLEVVEIDEHDRDQRALADGRTKRVPDTVGEQRAVGEVGDRVVERLMGQLLLERLALADVAAVEHDPLDVLVLEQLGVLHLELEPAAVAMAQRAVERVGLRPRTAASGDHRLQPGSVGLGEQPVEALVLDLLDRVAEHTLDRRALVGDDAVLVEHGDQVARVRDERAEARLALRAMEVLGERRGLDRQRDLRGECLEGVEDVARDVGRRLHDDRALVLVTHRQANDECGPGLSEAERDEDLLGRCDDGDMLAHPHLRPQPVRRLG